MAFDANGIFQRLFSWRDDRDAGIKILAERMDQEMDGMAAGLNSVVKNEIQWLGPQKIVSGTPALPAFTFTDDTDTGMFRSSSNVLGLTTGGTTAMLLSETALSSYRTVKIRAGANSQLQVGINDDTDPLIGLYNQSTLRGYWQALNDRLRFVAGASSSNKMEFLNSGALEINGNRALTTADAGHGNDLDADKLDGQHGAYYTDISARLGFTPLDSAGGTISGNLTVTGDFSVGGAFDFANGITVGTEIILSGQGSPYIERSSSSTTISHITEVTRGASSSGGVIHYHYWENNALLGEGFPIASMFVRGTGNIEWTAPSYKINGGEVMTTLNGGQGSLFDADLLDGAELSSSSSGVVYAPGTVVGRDGNSDVGGIRYLNAHYVRMFHGATQRETDTTFFSTSNDFIYKNNKLGMQRSLGVADKDGKFSGYTAFGSTLNITSPPNAVHSITSATGALKIRLPLEYDTASPRVMMAIRGTVFQYSNTGGVGQFEFRVSGYVYQDSNRWINDEASITYYDNSPEDHTVRLGYDADGYACIWIGETTSVWPITAVTVHEALARGTGSDALMDDWEISFEDTFGTVSQTHTNPRAGVKSFGNEIMTTANGGDGSGFDADLVKGRETVALALGGAVSSGTIPSRDASGDLTGNRYVQAAFLNMTHAAAVRSSDTTFFSSDDDFVRKNTKEGMRNSLGLNNRKWDAVLVHQEAAGVDGGDMLNTAWSDIPINTEEFDPDGLASISSSEFTFTKDGWIEWTGVGCDCSGFRSRLIKVSDGSVVATSASGFATSANNNNGYAEGFAAVEAGVAYKLDARSGTNRTVTGMGVASDIDSMVEKYSTVRYKADRA